VEWEGHLLVPWQKDLILQWADYVGAPDHTSEQMAWTFTCIKYAYEIEIIKRSSKVKFVIKNLKVTAYYNKSASWVKPALLNRTDQADILKHEQGHLDIAEEYARKIQHAMVAAVKGKSFSCKGKTEEEQQNYARTAAQQMLDSIYKKGFAEWHRDERRYDDESRHGLALNEQQKYNKRFDQLRI
jgi:predicted secreted Zn-dependent protease